LTGEDFKKAKANAKAKELARTRAGGLSNIRIMTWQEYCIKKGRDKPENAATIDVLLEEAVPFNPHAKVSLASNTQLPVQTTEELIARAKAFGRLPERIRINSRPIQEMLREVARLDEMGTVSDTSTIVCIKPFKMLFSLESPVRMYLEGQEKAFANLEKVKASTDDLQNEEKANEILSRITDLKIEVNDIKCLIQCIEIFLTPIKLRLVPASRPEMVRFEELWLLFQPGSLVVVDQRNVMQRIWKVIQKTGGRRYLRPREPLDNDADNVFGDTAAFTIDCYYIDFDGESLGPVMRTFQIPSFDNRRPIRSLSVCPVAIANPEFPETKENLMEMGKMFLEHTKVQHRYYSGKTFARQPSGELMDSDFDERAEILANVESAVVVDFGMAFQFQPEWAPEFNINKFKNDDPREWQEVPKNFNLVKKMDPMDGRDWLKPDIIMRDFEWDQRDRLSVQVSLDSSRRSWDSGAKPTGDDLLLLPGRVFGFVLKSRSWGESFAMILSVVDLTYRLSFVQAGTTQGDYCRSGWSAGLAAPKRISRSDSVVD